MTDCELHGEILDGELEINMGSILGNMAAQPLLETMIVEVDLSAL